MAGFASDISEWPECNIWDAIGGLVHWVLETKIDNMQTKIKRYMETKIYAHAYCICKLSGCFLCVICAAACLACFYYTG